MPLLHFTPPCKHKTTYTIFFLSNEILHKLTTCHFTLRNKNVERFMPKNTSFFFFHFSEQNCTIHKKTITQTHDLYCLYFSLQKSNFSYRIPFHRNFQYSLNKTLLSNFFFLDLHFRNFISEKYN